MVGIGVKVFFMEICQNCTAVTIETSPTFTAISGRSKKYWYAAPYPSSFHWWEGLKVIPWQVTEERLKQRDLFVLFIGSVKTSNTNSNFLRRTLHSQCLAAASASASPSGSNGTMCSWFTTAHACNGVVNATSQMLLFQRAVFCPAPPGDSITRKSIFDSLVSGCIPVIFAKGSMNQYLWYFNKVSESFFVLSLVCICDLSLSLSLVIIVGRCLGLYSKTNHLRRCEFLRYSSRNPC